MDAKIYFLITEFRKGIAFNLAYPSAHLSNGLTLYTQINQLIHIKHDHSKST